MNNCPDEPGIEIIIQLKQGFEIYFYLIFMGEYFGIDILGARAVAIISFYTIYKQYKY